MTRVLSGAVLLALAVTVIWFVPPVVFFVAAEALLVLAFVEYAGLARASGIAVPVAAGGAATALAAAAFTHYVPVSLDVVLMSGFVALAATTLPRWQGGRDALASVAAAVLPIFYLGLSIGALVAIREVHGREALALLMLTIIVSDTAQYYSGRTMGRRLLAPVISPKKTIEGAVGGFVFGSIFTAVAGGWWLPEMPIGLRALVGAAIVALGIAGDLFESMLKRSAGVKDSSALIPGHGGVLDRIDALLFAAPVYYVVLKWV
jgi:phosphatidate cytidylyltransferase